ncbi:response regulator [Pontibacter korlensis]|uniref:Fis family transcriptional regulator n=1 Tax=Pontibacter korlensis TaxID=400092 RepID=A0A0E3UZY5_9BACT|nr:response regulator [Pontibacter korlensis]AKD05731.1 Fis family transcriptional regulator [Pontibacter korlensis]
MKVLIVDDEADVQPLFEQRFRKEVRTGEIDLAFAFNGEEAYDYVEKHPFEVVLILSDINMPGMSGLELLRLLRQKYAVAPPMIIMITAYGDKESYQQAMQFGADDFLTKPLDFNLLKGKLKTLTFDGKDIGS